MFRRNKSADATTTEPGWLGRFWGGGSTGSGISVGPENAMQCATVMACCRILAEDVAKLPVGIYKTDAAGKSVIAKEHALYKLLRRPNAWQTHVDFFEQMMFGLLLWGNAYTVILRDGRGRPTQLVPIRPNQVTIMVAPEDGSLFYQVARSNEHDMAVLRSQPITIPARDVLHVKCLNTGGLLGMSVLAGAREAIGLAMATEAHGANLFRNGARPSGILEHPQTLSEGAGGRLRKQWDDMYSGTNNTGKTIVLEEGMAYKTLSMNSVDAEWLESRKFQVEEIARCFRVPLHMLQHMEKSTTAGAGLEQQTRAYYDQTLMPYLERIEAAFDCFFDLQEGGFSIEFDTWTLLRADIKTRFEVYARGRQWGIYSANDCRRREGDNPIENGDIYMAPVNMMPLESWVKGGWKNETIPAESDGSGRKE
ncbi:phage portal protein [Solidesulfovibrio sp.]